MAELAVSFKTRQEFYLWCEEQEDRFELVDGFPVPMHGQQSGASNFHDIVVTNALASLHSQLRGSPCRATTADTAVPITHNRCRRADMLVTCEPPKDKTYETGEPRLVMEVLSPSNRGAAWKRKLNDYRNLVPTLTYLVLVDPLRVWVSVETRSEVGWTESTHEDITETLAFPELGCELRLTDLYERLFSA